MPKKLVIVTYYNNVALLYSQQLRYLFGHHVDIETYSVNSSNLKEIEADVVLASTHSIYGLIKKYVRNYSQILIANITLTKDGLAKVQGLPEGTMAMLVNSNAEMAIDTISMIYQAGVTHVELFPVYPGMDDIPRLKLAITPGETELVPDGVDTIIDIGHRVLDLSTIVDIAVKLELDDILQEDNIRNFFKNNTTNKFGLTGLLNRTDRLENHLGLLLNVMDQGIIAVNNKGLIYIYNNAAQQLTKVKKEDALGGNAGVIFPNISFGEVLKTAKPVEGKIVEINAHDTAVTIYPIVNAGIVYSAVAMLRKFSDTERQQHKLRAQVLKKGHVAKYTFEHIIGQSNEIMSTKDIARNMARSDSNVLIYGESGSGKELFAQAIHNYSRRKGYPFIAVNCAAIPNSLLESELFGYEEGAFTGAKKGGKPGFFELAHMGTLFLDEIGEMALNLQARLLRVLQEREVIRVGGDSVIHIDVRIIAASNRHLQELVKQGNFRRDLYYRLNVLPLNIPSLRERKTDIMLLLEYFKKQFNTNFELSPEAYKMIGTNPWEGNVRELRNCVEYLSQTGSKIIELKDLPFYFPEPQVEYFELNEEEKVRFNSFARAASNNLANYLFILKELENHYVKRLHAGRRRLEAIAIQAGVYLTEAEIRGMLTVMENYQFIEVSKGRAGTKITPLGMQALKYLSTRKSAY